MNLLNITNLKKTYPNGVQALKGVTLSIGTGIYGLLGPNGAGKSTLMRTIATLQEADEGTIFFNDLDVLKEKHEVRKILGFLPQEFDVYPKATCYDLLNHIAILKGMTDSKTRKDTINILLEKCNLIKYKNKYLGSFSGGMKQRWGVAQALLGSPKLLIVDEPTAGLDPEERFRFHNILSELAENIIVILSTHIVDDVRELCNKMSIINEGQVLIENNPESILNQLEGNVWKKLIEKNETEKYEGLYKIISSRMYMGKTMIHVHADTKPEDGFTNIPADLEDVYFYYIHGLGKTEQPQTVSML